VPVVIIDPLLTIRLIPSGGRIKRLLVLEDNRLLGFVTMDDIMEAIFDRME